MPQLAQPFRALRPTAEHAAEVVAPPYDVLSTAEARQIAAGRPHDFLHISRPEIDFPDDVDPHSDAVYARGAETLARLERAGVLIRESTPCFYIYRLETATHEQTGVAMTASVSAYESNRVRKHELTRPDKENDRVRNIETLNAQTGPVLCAYRQTDRLRGLVSTATADAPLFSVIGPNDVRHTIWRVADTAAVADVGSALDALDALYIADGHHRSAAAARVAAERRARGESTPSTEYFLTVAFPHEEMQILDYNRAITSLGERGIADFLSAIEKRFRVVPVEGRCKPEAPHIFGLYVGGRWYRLELLAPPIANDPVANLDVSILQRELVEPIVGISDPRTDPRIEFIGGIRGLAALEQRVDSGAAAAAFALRATSMEELMSVADAERLMPPKSTWFEPKLADGLLSHVLD